MYFIIALIGWIVGISTLGQNLSPFFLDLGSWAWCISICLFIYNYFTQSLKNKKNSKTSLTFRLIFALSLFISAFYLGQNYVQQALEKRLSQRIVHSEETELIAYVSKLNQHNPMVADGNIEQMVEIIYPDQSLNKHVLVYYKDSSEMNLLELGKYYRLSGKIKPAHSYAVDGVFDQEKWLLQQNVMGTIQLKFSEQIDSQELKSAGYLSTIKQHQTVWSKLKLKIEKLRLAFREKVIKENYHNKGLMVGLLTGDESLLSQENRNLFRDLGISHLLAISGPHVLIFAALISTLINWLISRFQPVIYLNLARPYCLVLPFFLCVILYSLFSGFEIPALRTTLSVSIISIAILLKQQFKPFILLLISASILLLIDPFSILSPAFWLSYGACFILIRVYQTVVTSSDQPDSHAQNLNFNQIKKLAIALIESQWKIFIALFPLTIAIFQQVSWVAPIANLIAIPVIGLIVVPLEVVGYCFNFIPILAHIFYSISDLALSILVVLLEAINMLFSIKLTWLAISYWQLLALTFAIIILFLPKGIVPRVWSVILLLALFLPTKNSNLVSIDVIDVGQGQSIFIDSSDSKILIDTGGSHDESKFSIGERIIVPFMMKKGYSSLDLVMLSHLDQDHAGGFEKISEHITIKSVMSNEHDTRFNAHKFNYCYEGLEQQYDHFKIKILSPTQTKLDSVQYNRNETSCVVYLRIPHAEQYQNYLIMGDAGWETEFEILSKYPDLKVDVLVLGHHGSHHSSSYEFLKKLNPKLTIASAGYENRYQHPHSKVLHRLRDLDIKMLSTIQHGTIRFQTSLNGKTTVDSFRESKQWLQRTTE